MYSLDINFLSDRKVDTKTPSHQTTITFSIGNLTPVYVGVAVGVFFPVLMAGGWWFLQAKNADLEQKIAQLQQENTKLDAEIGNINKIKQETNTIKSETQVLVTVFDQIRPWSAMLQDLRDRIPAKVQIENIKQIPPSPLIEGQPPPNPAGGVEITGFARSYYDVNDFLLTLQQSRFLKSSESKITSATLVDAPIPPDAPQSTKGVKVKLPQIVKYTIQSSLSDVPASELIRELEQKGTVGLVARIRSLQQTGAIQK